MNSTINGEERTATISGVAVRGNGKVKGEVILERFGIAEGEIYSKEKVRKGLERIRQLSAVKYARIQERYDKSGSKILLTLTIDYRKTFKVKPAATRRYAGKLSIGAELSESNFRREDEDLNVLIMFRGATVLCGLWHKPNPRIPLIDGLGVNFSHKDYPYPYPQYRRDLIDKRIRRLEPAVSFHFGIVDYLSLVISPGIDKIFGDGPLLKDCAEGSDLPSSPSGLFSTFGISLLVEKIDDIIYPTHGIRAELSRKDWGVFGIGSEMRTTQYKAGADILFRAGRPLFIVRARSVFSGRGAPLLLLEHLGGENTIRGYEYGVITGENSFLAKLDLRIPLNFYDGSDIEETPIPLEFGLFMDTGTCWSKGDSISRELFHSGFGLSLNYISPLKAVFRMGGMWTLKSSAKFYLDVETLF